MVEFEIKEHLATLSSNGTVKKELCLVSWNGQPEKLDLRTWRTDQDGQPKPNKGLTLTDDEAAALARAIMEYLK